MRRPLPPAIAAALLGGPLPIPRVRVARTIYTRTQEPTRPIVFVVDRDALSAAFEAWARGQS